MHDDDYHLWFKRSNYISVLKIKEDRVEDFGLSVDMSVHVNRGEYPICLATAFSIGFFVVLYEGHSEQQGFVNQVFVLVRNLSSNPEVRLIDPQRVCSKSKLL